MRDLPTGTVTLLFTDIEGSTRLLHELGDDYAAVLAEHRHALRQAFRAHGGAEVDTQGDAFFYAFARAADALAAAEAGQRALDRGPVRVRMGIHTGEPSRTDEGYVGLDVHCAARVMAAGHGGQVVVSPTARALVASAALRDLGVHRLKDVGEIRLFQLGADEFPPLKSLNNTNLPAQPSALVGRERELEEAGRLLSEDRLVTLVGPGGSGKTRLALELAAEAVGEFPDGVFWVPLAGVADAALVERTVAGTLGAADGLADHVSDKHLLLLLDNFEQVLDAAPGVADVLARCPNLHVLVTSRTPLRVGAEREYAVEPLPERDAVELFRERAVTAEPREAVAEICRRLDGLPLAVELAAARTRLFPPERLLERLDRRLPLLTGGRRDAPERQRTLRATIEWSHDLLSPEERALFRQLAVFAGSFTVEAAEAVCDADPSLLESLLEQSLLRRWESGRLGMLETIRELAGERLDESGEGDRLRRRHAEYLLELTDSANLTALADGEQRHALVAAERDNVRAALEWGLSAGELELGLRLTIAAENYWVTAGPDEGYRWLKAYLERAGGALDPELGAHALRCYASVTYTMGDFEAGTRYIEQSLDQYRRLGDERGMGHMLFRLAVEANRVGDHERARALATESLELARRSGYGRAEPQSLALLGSLELTEGRPDRGLQLLEQSAAVAREIGFRWWEAGARGTLAWCMLDLDRLDGAVRHARAAVELAHAIEDRQNTLEAVAVLAVCAGRAGQAEHAGRLWGAIEAEEARGRIGRWEGFREQFAEKLEPLRDDNFERGRVEGRSLTLGDAVSLALSDVDSG